MIRTNGLGHAARESAGYRMILGLLTLICASQPIVSQALPLFGHRVMNPIAKGLSPFDPLFVAVLAGAITTSLLLSLFARQCAAVAWLLYGVWTTIVSCFAWHIDSCAAAQYLLYGISGIAAASITWKCRP